MSYKASQDIILDADILLAKGDVSGARVKYLEAARLQHAFVDSLLPNKVRTRSVCGLSAATLYFRGDDFDTAARLAHLILSSEQVEGHSAHKLEELLSRIKNERLLRDHGKRDISLPISMFLRGDEIGEGLAPANLVDRFTSSILSPFRRMAAWKSKLPFSQKPPPTILAKYRAFQLQPVEGSYRVDFYITEDKQLTLDLLDDVASPNEIVHSTMEFIQLAIGHGEAASTRIDDMVPDPDYKSALLRLVRNMIPSGKGVGEMEIRIGNQPKEQAVFLRPDLRPVLAGLINPSTIVDLKSLDQTSTENLSGILRSVDLDTRSVRLDTINSQPIRFTVPSTISDDVLSPMLNQPVNLQRYRPPGKKKWIIRDLDFSDNVATSEVGIE